MRLKQIKKILESTNINGLFLKSEPTSGGHIKLTDINIFKKSIEDIEQIAIFKSKVDAVKESMLYKQISDELYVDNEARTALYSMSSSLYHSAKALLEILQNMFVADSDLCISVKLPDISDLKELNSTLELFDKILNQTIINEDINGNLKIENFDNGTLWIDIFVGSLKAVTVISSIAWSSAVICKKYQEARMFQEHVVSLKIKNESMEDLLSAQKKLTKELIEAEAINIYDNNYEKTNKHEQVTRLTFAISTLAELMQKGAEIHPSLNAPESVQNLFPDMRKIDQIQSQIKQIEQKIEIKPE